MRRKASYTIVLFAVLALSGAGAAGASPGAGASLPLETDRGRVKVARVSGGLLTVHSDRSTPLRGGAAFVYETGRRTGKTKYVSDPAYYRAMRDAGLNAVRLVAFDAYQRSRGHEHADLDNPAEVAALLGDIDKVVDLASEAGLYVMINYHDVGGYDLPYLTKFWDVIAPRYRDRTHVLYELMNEPVKWFPRDYTDQHLQDFQAFYARVRALAPDTHLVLLTFANTAAYDKVSMGAVAQRLTETGSGIDWGNASVAFHPYQTTKKSRHIADLAARFPAINTEQNLPNNEGCIPMDGEEFGVQTMERLGLSWFHWHTHGPERLAKNFLGRVALDAKLKGYAWE